MGVECVLLQHSAFGARHGGARPGRGGLGVFSSSFFVGQAHPWLAVALGEGWRLPPQPWQPVRLRQQVASTRRLSVSPYNSALRIQCPALGVGILSLPLTIAQRFSAGLLSSGTANDGAPHPTIGPVAARLCWREGSNGDRAPLLQQRVVADFLGIPEFPALKRWAIFIGHLATGAVALQSQAARLLL